MRKAVDIGVRTIVVVVFVVAVAYTAPAWGQQAPAGEAAADGPDAFQWAYRFASALDVDPKDKASAQHLVVGSLVEVGELERAADLVGEVEGWRRGVAAAAVAREAIRTGDGSVAERMTQVARQVAGEEKEWSLRIQAHLVRAYALAGEEKLIARLNEQLAADLTGQFAGRGEEALAVAYAVDGHPDKALAELEKLDDVKDLYAAHRRTEGYMTIGRLESLPHLERIRFLEKAVESGRKIPGPLKTRPMTEAAEELAHLGRRDKAVTVLSEVEEYSLKLSDGLDGKAPILCNLARAWVRAGSEERARSLLEAIEQAIAGKKILKTDRPGFVANLASVYAVLGDEEGARREYRRALDLAKQLVNARPRALAIVEICSQMGRHGFEPGGPLAAKLEGLFDGLGAPW